MDFITTHFLSDKLFFSSLLAVGKLKKGIIKVYLPSRVLLRTRRYLLKYISPKCKSEEADLLLSCSNVLVCLKQPLKTISVLKVQEHFEGKTNLACKSVVIFSSVVV